MGLAFCAKAGETLRDSPGGNQETQGRKRSCKSNGGLLRGEVRAQGPREGTLFLPRAPGGLQKMQQDRTVTLLGLRTKNSTIDGSRARLGTPHDPRTRGISPLALGCTHLPRAAGSRRLRVQRQIWGWGPPCLPVIFRGATLTVHSGLLKAISVTQGLRGSSLSCERGDLGHRVFPPPSALVVTATSGPVQLLYVQGTFPGWAPGSR